MLRRTARRGGLAALVLLATGGICAAGGAWRLAQGPVPLDRARPAVERLLQLQAPGSRATVRHAELAWFAGSHALGLRLHDVDLRDGSGRQILSGQDLEAGFALESILALRPCLAHVTARRFFAAVSVSPQGRYALGYDAAGRPGGTSGLVGAVGDLTGQVRMDRPLSWLRQASFSDGRIAFRQVGAPLAWTGEVRQVQFSKAANEVRGLADLRVATAGGVAQLRASGGGRIGLTQASAKVRIDGLAPAAILPSVGATRQLAVWSAPVAGGLVLQYAAGSGIRAADVDLVSGPGSLRLASGPAAVRGAAVRAHFQPDSQTVVLDEARIDSDADRFALSGWSRLQPARGADPAELRFALASDGGYAALAETRTPAAFKDLRMAGRITPALRRVEFTHGEAQVGPGRAVWRGVVTGGRRGRSPRVDIDARVLGKLDVSQILALWPRKLSGDARDWVSGHISAARAGDARFTLRLPSRINGDQHPLPQEAIAGTFKVQDARVWIGEGFPTAEGAEGDLALTGDHLQVQLRSAVAHGLRVSGGSVEVTHFKGPHRELRTNLRLAGPARNLLEVVDGPGDHVLTKGGFAPSRLDGQVEASAEINRPLLDRKADPPLESYDIRYAGRVRNMTVRDAVLGMALRTPAATFQGTRQAIRVDAPGVVGPYRGAVRYQAVFGDGPAGRARAEVDGALDAALVGMGGPATRPMPFSGSFDLSAGGGRGQIHSAGFTGAIDWTGGVAARSEVRGALDGAALRAAGVPVSRSMNGLTPARLILARNGVAWTGALSADLYSGAISFTPGERSHLRYTSELTPTAARRLGLGDSPVFRRPQPLMIDLSVGRGDGSGVYSLGPLGGRVGWADGPAGRRVYRWQAMLGEADLRMMGLPAGLKPRGPVPVDVSLTGQGGAWDGSATVAGARLHVSASNTPGGGRRVIVNGPAPLTTLQTLGLQPPAGSAGQVGLSANLLFAAGGFTGGQVTADLTRTAFVLPHGLWRKAAGQPFGASFAIARRADGLVQASRLHASGGGLALDGDAAFTPDGLVLHAANLQIPQVYDGALDVASTSRGVDLNVRARFVDARSLMSSRGDQGAASGGPLSARFQVAAAQVRVSDRLILQDVRAAGTWGPPADRRLQASARANGGGIMSLALFPQSGGTGVHGRVENVSNAAATFFDLVGFRGGVADVTGRLGPEGADLLVEMHNVRLTHAPVLAQALSMGSLTGMANTLNGQGIEFTHVVAPLKLRGDKLYIGQARATGPALGVTTQGVLDLQEKTVAMNGAIAPAYTLNGMFRHVPVVGRLLVPRNGEGMFGVTYSARGGWGAPKIAVNPLSLAAPGFLRRMFEGRAETPPPTAGGGAVGFARR